MIWADKTKFDGEWWNGMAHGRGKLTYPDGHIVEGVWKNNLLIDNNYMEKILPSSSGTLSHKPKSLKTKSVSILNNSNLNV
jgi:hypothetical protein